MLRKKLKINEITPSSKENDATGDMTKSKFFKVDDAQSKEFWRKVYEIECQLYAELLTLPYPASICAVYNPLDYARALHCQFMAKFLDGPKDLLFVGMNPGPWGCCQTGVLLINGPLRRS
jgi:single-strand selective monofunctional uracil DNA glycosylase